MKRWLLFALPASLFIAWAYVHTGEITVVIAFLLTAGFVLGFTFPRGWLLAGLFLGIAPPIDEVLITTVHLRAPFEGGHPFTAWVAFLPALMGTALGRFSRKGLSGAGAKGQ